jgi:hypothetical protein
MKTSGILASAVFAVILAQNLRAAEGTPQTPPKDTRAAWSVAFTAFSANSLPPERRYLAFSVPLLVRDGLSGLTTHFFNEEERALNRALIVKKELGPLYQGLQQLRRTRDEAALAKGKAAEDAEKSLQAALDRIRWLESLDLSLIEMAEEKPVVFKEGTATGKLFDSPQYSPYQFAIQNDVDLLVGGTVSAVESYVLVELWAFEPSRESVVYSFRDAASPEGIYEALDTAVKGLIGVILGREWASLSVIPDPPGSIVSIDGKSMGAGRVQAAYVAPGQRRITVEAAGFEGDTRTVELAAYAEEVVTVGLVKNPMPMISFTSSPPGADVYLDSVWKGKTPLSLETPAIRSRVLLGLEGYYDLPISVEPGSPVEIALELQPDIGSRVKLQEKARDDFYFAFGFFALSLPIPLFCNAYYIDYAVEAQRLTNPAAASEALMTSDIFRYSYYGSAAASASLFAWMIVNLVNYILASERAAE